MCAHKANMCSCPEKLDGEMLPSCSGILAKTVSIASYSLQQDNLLLLPRFCNARICTNRNSLFYCNKSAAEAWICLVLSHGSHHAFFSVQTNWNGGRMAERKSCIFTCKIIMIIIFFVNPLTVNPTKWSNTLPTNCLSVFNHFVGLALKGLKYRCDTVFSTFFSLVQNVMKRVI